jgi:hypothetical protein
MVVEAELLAALVLVVQVVVVVDQQVVWLF